MKIEDLKYTTPTAVMGYRSVSAIIDGTKMLFSDDSDNTHWAECLAQGLTPADYVPPAPAWVDIRSKRDSLLAATDWWAVSDRAMSAAEAAYRQSLRDVPQTFSSPADVVWPTKP
jgi:hypothetical protein